MSLLTKLSLCWALLRARRSAQYARLAYRLHGAARTRWVREMLAPAPTADEVSAARRRAFLAQHHELGS